jgi:hypothetical protein
VQWIDRGYLKRKEELDKQKRADLEEEVRQQRMLEARAEAARAHLEAAGGRSGASIAHHGICKPRHTTSDGHDTYQRGHSVHGMFACVCDLRSLDAKPSELQREEGDGAKIVVSLGDKPAADRMGPPQAKRPRPNVFGGGDDDEEDGGGAKAGKKAKAQGGQGQAKSELDRLIELDALNKKARARTHPCSHACRAVPCPVLGWCTPPCPPAAWGWR